MYRCVCGRMYSNRSMMAHHIMFCSQVMQHAEKNDLIHVDATILFDSVCNITDVQFSGIPQPKESEINQDEDYSSHETSQGFAEESE